MKDKRPGEKAYDPWDMSPAKPGQVAYLEQLTATLAAHDWSKLDTSRASGIIDKLNGVRRQVGIPFQDFTDVDAARLPYGKPATAEPAKEPELDDNPFA